MTTPAKPDVLALAQRAKELAEKATPGPWKYPRNNKVGYVFGPDCVVAECGDFRAQELVPFNHKRWNADADFIAFAREALPLLAEAVETLTRELAEAKRQLAEMRRDQDRGMGAGVIGHSQ